jgi:hypothetical protein
MTSPTDALSKIWLDLGLPADALERVRLTGTEPALPSSFRVGTAAQASIAAASLAAAEVWRLRGGPAAEVTVDMRHAAIEFRSERYFSVEGRPPPALWDKIAGTYRCGDGRWVRIHTNFPHHRDGILELLKCDYAREAVQEALDGWTAEAFETAAGAVGMIAAMMRSKAEWLAHPQGQAVASLPLISIEKIGEAAPEPLPPAARPLDSLRVLDLTRIIAGPVCGRALAAHGAEVLYVTGPHLPAIAPLVIDTGRGKRSTQIDLREPAGTAALAALLEDADLFVQGYRPGGLAERGFSPEEAAALRPGIVYLSRPQRALGGQTGFRLHCPDHHRHQPSRSRHARPRPPQGAALPGPRPCLGLSSGPGGHGRADAAGPRGRQLARARRPRPHRAVAAGPGPARGRLRLPGPGPRGCRRPARDQRVRLRAPQRGPARGADRRRFCGLAPACGAAGQPPAGLVEACRLIARLEPGADGALDVLVVPVGVLALLDFTAQHVPLRRLKLACPWGLPVSLYLRKRTALEVYPLTIVALHSQVRLWLARDHQARHRSRQQYP